MNARTPVRAAALALGVALLAGAQPAYAFRMIQNTTTGRVSAGSLVPCDAPGGFVHWRDASTSWRHNLALQGGGKATALQSAMASWTGVAGASHRLNYSGTTGAGFVTDGQNTLLWANGNGCVGNCLALTALVLQAGQVIVESDVTFNNAVTWTTDGTDFDTESVAAHELGHALGIHHTDVATAPTPTMNAFYFGPDGRTLSPDDIAALQCSQNRFPPTPVLRVQVPAGTAATVPGDPVTFTASILRGPGFASPVSFSLLAAPPGVTLTQSPNPATGASATLTLTVSASAPIGNHTVTVLSSGGGEADVDSLTLPVKRLLVSTAGLTLFAGEPTETTGITIRRASGFVAPVTLTITGMPPGTGTVLRISPITTIGSSSTLSGRASRVAPEATYFPTLHATAGSVTDSQVFEVDVISPFPFP
jgi:hypothetical protein